MRDDDDFLNRRLRDLLFEPRETLDVEIKGWLDIRDTNFDKAVLAKAIIALANHGGGMILIGLQETDNGFVEADDRPENLAVYTPDTVNAVVHRYIEPSFHCDLQIVFSPQNGLRYPVVIVPGGHKVPIRSVRSGPEGNALQQNVYYIRRPGPQSQSPQSAQEWDTLIRRCLKNSRDDLLDHFRHLMAGGIPENLPEEDELDKVTDWFRHSFARWEELTQKLPRDHPGCLTSGHYAVAYQLFSPDLGEIRLVDLRKHVVAGEVRYSGWPPFWIPTRERIEPYISDNTIECWLGHEEEAVDPAHADFWRISPSAQFFLLRGYQEDGPDSPLQPPRRAFDLTLPTWRLGEILLHAESMARQLDVPNATLVLMVKWSGLENRELVAWASQRILFDGHVANQDTFQNHVIVPANEIQDSLPELVDTLVRPLYERFDFFELPRALTTEELGRMRQRRF